MARIIRAKDFSPADPTPMKTPGQSSKLLAILYVVILFGAATLLPGFAQETDPSRAQRPRQVLPRDDQEPDEVLKVDTDLVSLDVFAQPTPTAALVRNLKQEISKFTSTTSSSRSPSFR